MKHIAIALLLVGCSGGSFDNGPDETDGGPMPDAGSVSSGGAPSTGGAASTGGSMATGGHETGGTSSAGGTRSTGGVPDGGPTDCTPNATQCTPGQEGNGTIGQGPGGIVPAMLRTCDASGHWGAPSGCGVPGCTDAHTCGICYVGDMLCDCTTHATVEYCESNAQWSKPSTPFTCAVGCVLPTLP